MPLILDLPFASLVSVISTIVMVLFILSAFLLTVVILLQEGKGGGLSGAFGGAGTDAFGVKSGTVNKFTAWLGGLFLGLALLHAGLVSASGTLKLDDPVDTPDTGKFTSPVEDEESGDEGAGDAGKDGDAAEDGDALKDGEGAGEKPPAPSPDDMPKKPGDDPKPDDAPKQPDDAPKPGGEDK